MTWHQKINALKDALAQRSKEHPEHGLRIVPRHHRAHSIRCRCPRCLDLAFGPLDAVPPDLAEVRAAQYGDTGVRTVNPND